MASNEHSAEWLRGAVAALEEYPTVIESCDKLCQRYRALLAAAEAREAAHPSAAEVIAAAEATLIAIVSRCVPLGEDSGDSGTVIIAESGLSAIARYKEAHGAK